MSGDPPPSHPFITITRCGHVFHRACIAQWLRSGRIAGGDCPLCKEPIMQGALQEQVDAALGSRVESQSRPARMEDAIDAWAGPTQHDMDRMRSEAATDMAASVAVDTSGRTDRSNSGRVEIELERSASWRPPVATMAVVRQQAFRVRQDDTDGSPMLVSELDPDLLADLVASGLTMEEIGTHLGMQS